MLQLSISTHGLAMLMEKQKGSLIYQKPSHSMRFNENLSKYHSDSKVSWKEVSTGNRQTQLTHLTFPQYSYILHYTIEAPQSAISSIQWVQVT